MRSEYASLCGNLFLVVMKPADFGYCAHPPAVSYLNRPWFGTRMQVRAINVKYGNRFGCSGRIRGQELTTRTPD
jgi:hypothetical protein